jgi:hypothetical protein
LRFEQAPALAAELVLPGGVDAGEPGAERREVDLVEGEAAGDEGVAQARI